MSTIGHPLSDLVNLVTPWTMTDNTYGITAHQAFDTSRATAGLPTMNQCVEWYRQVAGWDPAPDIPWGVAFWLFRTTVVMQGIAARYASRQASGTTAREFGLQMKPHARMASDHIAEVKRKQEGAVFMKGRL
jgi:aminoglycoside phosphotransferase (APT) family kinase protein